MSISIAVEAGIILAGSMHDEVRGQTLASLMMIPRSSTGIIYSKFAGAMLGWLPGPIIVLVFTFSTRAGKDSFWSLFWNNHEQAGFLIFLLFALIPHFATVVSLYIRWGSVPIAIGMTIGVYFLIVAMAMLFAPNGPANGVLLIFDFVLTVLCVACHLAVLLRVQALAAR
jgi:hypothetical protein